MIERIRNLLGAAVVALGLLTGLACFAAAAPNGARAAGHDGERPAEPADATRATDSAPLVVGIKEAPPFSMKGPDGRWSGLAADLWSEIASDLD